MPYLFMPNSLKAMTYQRSTPALPAVPEGSTSNSVPFERTATEDSEITLVNDYSKHIPSGARESGPAEIRGSIMASTGDATATSDRRRSFGIGGAGNIRRFFICLGSVQSGQEQPPLTFLPVGTKEKAVVPTDQAYKAERTDVLPSTGW